MAKTRRPCAGYGAFTDERSRNSILELRRGPKRCSRARDPTPPAATTSTERSQRSENEAMSRIRPKAFEEALDSDLNTGSNPQGDLVVRLVCSKSRGWPLPRNRQL